MFFARFRPRSAERDRQNDDARHARLLGLIDELIREVENERRGLRKRYEKSVVNASFSLEAAEGNRAGDARLGELEAAVVYCERRGKVLEEQVEAFRKVKAETAARLRLGGSR